MSSLTGCPIIYPLKQENICDYDPKCIVSSGLIFNYIIMNIISNNKLECYNEEDNCFLQIFKQPHVYVQGVTSRLLMVKRDIQLSRCSMCTFSYYNKWYETLFDKHIKEQHFKW